VADLIDEFVHIFEKPNGLPPFHRTNHKFLILQGSNLVNVRSYKYPHFQKQEIERLIREMMETRLIQKKLQLVLFPSLLVRKKDGSWQFCIDYRALKAITNKNRFPIPSIDELLDEIHGTHLFSKLDFCSGYHRMRMHEANIHKTTFQTHEGHYEFLVMSFGLCNVPATFQATMNEIFQPYLWQFVIVFFDNILIYSKTLDEHLLHLRIIFLLFIN